MGERAMKNPKIEFFWSSQVLDILGENEVEKVKIKSVKDGSEQVVEAKGFFAALGHIPNTKIFDGLLDSDEKGFIKCSNNSSYTNVEGVFAAGDCADHVYRQAITAAGMGCKAAIDAERWLQSSEA
jgi:thioredoxin reductase (NADPH)